MINNKQLPQEQHYLCQVRRCGHKATRQSDVSLILAIGNMSTDDYYRHARVLERKLDDIMTLLTREREQEATIRSPQILERLTFSNESPAGTSMQSSCQNQPSVPPSLQSTGIVPSESSISIVPGFDVSFLEADQVLQEYMNTMLPEFPFVPLSFKSSSEMLRSNHYSSRQYYGSAGPRRLRFPLRSKTGFGNTLQIKLLS